MLTRMRAHRQLWGQLRRHRVRIAPDSGLLAFPTRIVVGPSTPLTKFPGDAFLGFRSAQYGFSSSASSSLPPDHQSPANRVRKDFEPNVEAELGGVPESPKEEEAFGVKGGNGVMYVVGAGTVALLTLVVASTDVFNTSDVKLHVEAGVSAILNSGAGIGRELVKMAGSIKDASVQTIVDFVEAAASIWVLARCLSSVLDSAVENANFEMGSWWRPRVASLLAGISSIFFLSLSSVYPRLENLIYSFLATSKTWSNIWWSFWEKRFTIE